MMRGEVVKHGVSGETQLAEDVPPRFSYCADTCRWNSDGGMESRSRSPIVELASLRQRHETR